MINFFRKIRKQLADDNKPLKYMRYAIGEIFLVVIGILIALQLNNWNELRKANKNEIKLLVEIKNSLYTNKAAIKFRVEEYKIMNANGRLLKRHLRAKLPYSDTLPRYLLIPSSSFSYGLSYSGYENLKSEGFNNITNDSIRLNIIKLYDEEFGWHSDQEIKMSNILANSITPQLLKDFQLSSRGLEPNDYQQVLNSSEYSNTLSFIMFTANYFKNRCEVTIKEIDLLINAIEIEIEKRKK